MEHLEGEWEKRKFDAPLLKDQPTAYMTCGRAYYACEPEEKTIPYVAKWIGEDQLLYASDYPHWDSEWPETVSTLLERDDLTLILKRKILSENALRFYGPALA
jgi:predicted TIM-barrel fold metal-dependent hydrolase